MVISHSCYSYYQRVRFSSKIHSQPWLSRSTVTLKIKRVFLQMKSQACFLLSSTISDDEIHVYIYITLYIYILHCIYIYYIMYIYRYNVYIHIYSYIYIIHVAQDNPWLFTNFIQLCPGGSYDLHAGWLVGWLKRLMAVATVPGHNPPKTSSQTLPASFWWSVYPKKRKPVLKEQNPMTASQKPTAHTAVHFF